MEPRIEVSGVRELRREIRRSKDVDLVGALKAAGREGADRVAYTAQTLVKVTTSRLLETIRASSTTAAGVVRAGTRAVPYAGVHHFGWPERGIEPNPFLYDAADARAAEVTDIYFERINEIAEAIERRSQPTT